MSITNQLEQLALFRADSADTSKLLDKAMKPSGARLSIRVEELIADRDRLLAALEGLLNVPENSNLDVAVESALDAIAKSKGAS